MTRFSFIALILSVVASCKPDGNASGKLVISVSILPQQYFIQRIAGEMAEVNVLIPPGASPATYEPTASQLSKLDQSAVYMRIGYVGFEQSWMGKIIAVNPDIKIVDLSEGIVLAEEEGKDHIQLHGHTHGNIDPHIWMSVLNAKIIARNTYRELAAQLPDESQKLKENYDLLLLELEDMHHSIIKMLSGKEKRGFMIYHPALTYFARDYNLEQYPLEIEGKTPSPAHMKFMVDMGKEKKISTIFVQNQFDQKNATVLAKEIGATIIEINPLDPDWKQQMLFIAKQLSIAL